MSAYSSLDALMNTTEGMDVLRNNAAQDDGVDTVTGVDWFSFNGTVVSKLYVSGNSFVGFNTNTEHLKVCRRDAKMYYLYRQEGTVGNNKFLKIRWQGFGAYNQTSAAYALQWELFLFDDGGIFLNLVKVPSQSGYLGTSSLTVGSKTYTLSVTLGTPTMFSFVPDETEGFIVSEEQYPVALSYVSSGSVEYQIQLGLEDPLGKSRIGWVEDIPEGTTISVEAKLTGEYQQCTNGEPIPMLSAGQDVSQGILYIRISMTTSDVTKTPTLSQLSVQLWGQNDDRVIVLVLNSGNTRSIQNAVGEVKVGYSGGTLKGLGGAVSPFEEAFTPTNLTAKNNPYYAEHIEVTDISVSSNLMRIYYRNVASNEHIEISDITATGVLTNISDI